MILKEIVLMINQLMSIIPGKIGIYIRMIWYRYQWKIPKNIEIKLFSEFISPRNIMFKGKASLSNNCFFTAENSFIEIGENFACNTNFHANASIGGKIKIGNNVLVGPNVVLRTANHNYENKDNLIINQGHNFGDITVRDNVWIGSNCTILSNVTIGTGSVIAAGSVVNKDVLPYTLVGGVPAKLIKKF